MQQHRQALRDGHTAFEERICFSLLLRVRDEPERTLRRAIDAVRAQTNPCWQLCVVDEASSAPHVARALGHYADDPRVRVVRLDRRGTVAEAWREALALADGLYVGFLATDDVLAEEALAQVACVLAKQPDSVLVYTDEDRINDEGQRAEPRFKTGWNPDLLLAQPYFGALSIYPRSLLERIGSVRDGFEGAEDYDLALRATAGAPEGAIKHIPMVLCHRGGSTERVADRTETCVAALSDHLRADGIAPQIRPVASVPFGHRVLWPRPAVPVSVIVPTRDRPDLLRRCAEGVLGTPNSALELVIVDNGSREPKTLALLDVLAADPRVRVLKRPGPFNWSALNNAAASVARGDVLVLLNNDVEVIDPEWLDELVAQAVRPPVGIVGAKLLFANGRVQHAGIWLGPLGRARHLLRLSPDEDPGYLGQLALARNLSAVTGACLALRRAVFFEAGGLDERLEVSFNDVDLCLRVAALGYRIVYTPHARLRHLKSASRGRADEGVRAERSRLEHAILRERWKDRLDHDPFRNPNLDLIGEEVLALRVPSLPAGH